MVCSARSPLSTGWTATRNKQKILSLVLCDEDEQEPRRFSRIKRRRGANAASPALRKANLNRERPSTHCEQLRLRWQFSPPIVNFFSRLGRDLHSLQVNLIA